MDTVRSEWERRVESYIRHNFPGLTIKTNDRTTIPSRETNQNLEIDIYIPSLRLGFELNGEPYHNRFQYMKDKNNGTDYSEERYKELYCKSKGIRLINIWSSEGETQNLAIINKAIRAAQDGDRIYPSTGTNTISYASRNPLESVDWFNVITTALIIIGAVGIIFVARETIQPIAAIMIIGAAIISIAAINKS